MKTDVYFRPAFESFEFLSSYIIRTEETNQARHQKKFSFLINDYPTGQKNEVLVETLFFVSRSEGKIPPANGEPFNIG